MVLSGVGGLPPQAILSDVEAGLQRALEEGQGFAPYAASIAAALNDRGEELSGSKLGCTGDQLSLQETFLTASCLSSLLGYIDPRHPVYVKSLHFSIRSYTLLLVAAHPCFATLLPDSTHALSEIKEVLEMAGAVLLKLVEVSLTESLDHSVYAPFCLAALHCALGVDSKPLRSAASEGFRRLLTAACTAPGLSEAMLIPAQSALLTLCGEAEGDATAHWTEATLAWCTTIAVGGSTASPEQSLFIQRVKKAVVAGSPQAVEGLLKGMQFANAVKAAVLSGEMGRLGLGCGAIVVAADLPETQEGATLVLLGAKLVLSATMALRCGPTETEAERNVLLSAIGVAATALSMGAAKSATRNALLSQFLLKLKEIHKDAFTEALEYLKGEEGVVSTLNAQLNAAVLREQSRAAGVQVA